MTSVTLEDAAKTLERYGLVDVELKLLSNVDCTVFRICAVGIDDHVDRRSAVLKVYPHHKQQLAAIRVEVEWLQALGRDTGLQVPKPLPARDGEVIQQVDCGPLTGPYCVLFTWVEGRSRDADLTPDAMQQIGAFVGQLHGHSQRWNKGRTLPLERRTYSQMAPTWILDMAEPPPTLPLTHWHVLQRAARKLNQQISDLGERADMFGLVHSDLYLSNFLFHAGRVGVIDFSDCARGHYADDIASVLVFLKHPIVGNFNHSASYDHLRDAFLAGYAAEQPLPLHLDHSLAVYFPARIFLLLAYVHDASDAVAWVPDCIVQSVDYLERYVSE